MSNQELYIFTGGRGNTQRQAHYTFTDILRAAKFAQKINGKLVPMLHYCDGHWLTLYNVWFDYIEAEYKEVPEDMKEHGHIRDNY